MKSAKMLQQFYRGFAGAPGKEEVFVTPQRRVADYYAAKRSQQTGLPPGVEAVLADPFAGRAYGHALPVDKLNRDFVTTQARQLTPADVMSSQILEKKQGGLAYLAGGGDAFKEMVKAYKLFRRKPNDPETLYPLFVNANKPVPVGEWLRAEVGPLSATGKVKSEIGELAYRPGWHAGDLPIATHIGDYNPDQLLARKPINEMRKQMILERNATTKAQRAQINKEFPYPEWATKPTIRPEEQVWAEINMPADVDWQKIAEERALLTKAGTPRAGTAHITDQIPFGGHYRYKTNPNMLGNWLISGDMRVNRVLPNEEVSEINRAAGLADLPRLEEYLNSIKNKSEGGLAHMASGGKTPAWQRAEGKNPEGGLNAKGRASYKAETGGTLKRPQPEGGARRDSFCARMKGMKKKLTSAETANDPDSRINKSLRKWNC
jgi:hypothetical protein